MPEWLAILVVVFIIFLVIYAGIKSVIHLYRKSMQIPTDPLEGLEWRR